MNFHGGPLDPLFSELIGFGWTRVSFPTFQLVFVSVPSIALNLYCLMVIMWKKELRGLDFVLIAIQSGSDSVYNGLFTALRFASEAYTNFQVICFTLSMQEWLTSSKPKLVKGNHLTPFNKLFDFT